MSRSLAERIIQAGVSHLDLGVYRRDQPIRLVNSLDPSSGLYRVPLEYKELRDFGLDYVLEVSQFPRQDESMAVPEECPRAVFWFAKAQRWWQARQRRMHLSVTAAQASIRVSNEKPARPAAWSLRP